MLDKFKVLRNAETYVVNRQFGRAIKEYRSLLETKGEDPALLNTLGDLLLKNKEQAEALTHFRRVAQIFIESGFTNKAIAVCKKIYKLDPSDRDTVGQLADLYTKRGFQSQAAKYYRQLVAESRDEGRFQEAADWQKHLLTAFPGEPKPFAEMAELNLELEEGNGALGNFVTASWLSFNNGAYQESVEYADQALLVDEKSEAASRLKEVASCVLVDGDSVLSDPEFQLDDELFASIVPSRGEESEAATRTPAGKPTEELVTAPRATESSEGLGEPEVKAEEDWSKGQEAVDDYSAVGEFDGGIEGEATAAEAEDPDELLTAAEAESEPEAEPVHELSEDIIDNDLQDFEELLKDVAQVDVDLEQDSEDFGMVEGARLGELDIKVGGTVDGFERYGEVLGAEEVGESPTEPESSEQPEELTGAQEQVITEFEAEDEYQLDSMAVEAAAAEIDTARATPEDGSVEGLVGTDEHLQEDTLAEAIDETSPDQALASELDHQESSPTPPEDEQSVSGVVEIPDVIETLEEPLDALVEDDELSASSVREEADEIFEVSVEESAEEVLERLEEVPFESEGADLGCDSAINESHEDETVLEIADDFSTDELSSVSVEDLFEEAVSAEKFLDSNEESLEQTLDLDEIGEFESKHSDTAVTFQGLERIEDELGVEEESAEHQTIDDSREDSVLDQELLHKSDDDESQSDQEDLEEPKLEATEQEIFKSFQEPPSFWGKLRDTVLGRSDVDEEDVADEDASEEAFVAIETVDRAAGESVEYERIDDVESRWGAAETVEDAGVDEQDSAQEEVELDTVEAVVADSDQEIEEELWAVSDEELKDGYGAEEVREGEDDLETEGVVGEEATDIGLVALEDGDESVLDSEREPEEQIDLAGEDLELEQADTTGEEEWGAKEEAKEEEETTYGVGQAEETATEEVAEADKVIEAAVEEVVEEEHTYEAEAEEDAGEAVDEVVIEAAEVVDGVAAETIEDAQSDQEEPELSAGKVVEVASDEEVAEASDFLSGDETEGEFDSAEAAESDLEQGARAEEYGEEVEPIEIEVSEDGGESAPEVTVEPEEAVELVSEEQLEVTIEEDSVEESEESPTFDLLESEDEVTSQPTVDARESAEDAQVEDDGEEITFETESDRETGVVSPEEVVEPVEAVESLTAGVVEEEAVGEEAPEIEAWETDGGASVKEFEATLYAEDQADEESESAPAEVSAEKVELEADDPATARAFEEPHSFWDKLRDAVMGGASDGDEEEAGATVSEEVIEVREAVEGAVEEVVEDEHTCEAKSEQEVSEAVPEDLIEGRDSDQEELELAAEEAEEELNAISDEEVENDLEAVEVAEGDGEAVVEADEVAEAATEVGLGALEDGDGSILEKEGEPEEQQDLTDEEREQTDITGEEEWVAEEEQETAYEVAQAEETGPEEVVEAAEVVEAVEAEIDKEEYTYETESEQEAIEDVGDEVVEAAEAVEESEANFVEDEQSCDAESEQETGEAVHAEVVEASEAAEGAVEEGIEEPASDQERLAVATEEAEEDLNAVSELVGKEELEAVEAVAGDVEEIVEQEDADEEEPRYAITDLWKKLVKKALSEDETEAVAEPEEVEAVAAIEPEAEWEAPQDSAVEDESDEKRELAAQENLDVDGEPSEVDALEFGQDGDSAVEHQDEKADHEAPIVDPESDKSRDYNAAVTETWQQPSVYADSRPNSGVEGVPGPYASTAGWQSESDETGNGDGGQDLGSLEEALQEYDFNIKLGLREEAERLIAQLLEEHAFDERVLLRAKSHGMSLPSTEPESETVEEGEKTIEAELDSAFEDIFKLPGDEIPEDVLVFELDTTDNAPSDESKVQYDLGLGYREMGLLDDAVEKFEEAFEVAIETDDQDHAANCCGMLASTYMELTEYRKVLKWADRGLGLHVAKAFEEKALRYERAQALEMLGEFRQSLDTYRVLMEQDPAFRDVRARVGRLNLLSN